MQLFQINAMNVSRDKFKSELEKNGLKYGYIPRLYEKFKQGEMTCFRLVIEDYQFVVVTDDESSYPEIQEETGKKIEIEPYSLEWLEYLIYDSNILGPSFYESLLRHLQKYIRVKKAEKNDETKEQKNCPYCDEQLLAYEIGADAIPESGKGYAIEHGDIKAFIAKENGKYYLRHNFTPNSSDFFLKMEIKFCPICGRKLEA